MGTNLREPVPADPRLIPQFVLESTTPAQRATESAELIAQAGVSARRLGVSLTLHDFPRDPAIHGGGENEDPMHSAVPLFGIHAPRWRAKEGLPLDIRPGLATYNGVPAPPTGRKGRRLYAKKAQKLNPKSTTFEAATAPVASSSSSSSSISSALDRFFDLLNAPLPPPLSLKRTRKAAELEHNDNDNGDDGPSNIHGPSTGVVPPTTTKSQENAESEAGEPQRKRCRRSASPTPSTSIGQGVNAHYSAGDGRSGPGQLRRSTRIARAQACTTNAPVPVPASRKRRSAGNSKRSTRT